MENLTQFCHSTPYSSFNLVLDRDKFELEFDLELRQHRKHKGCVAEGIKLKY